MMVIMECHRCGKDKVYHGKGKKMDPEKGGHRFDSTPQYGTIRWVNKMMRRGNQVFLIGNLRIFVFKK